MFSEDMTIESFDPDLAKAIKDETRNIVYC